MLFRSQIKTKFQHIHILAMYDFQPSVPWMAWYGQADINTCLILIQCRIVKISVQNFYFIEFYLLALSDMAGTPEPGVPIYFCGPKTFSSPQWEDLI